jgi:asparagine synthase (glutamine-hydrolysing)
MCGIAGIVAFAGAASRETLCAMNRMLVHRGPDDGGEWVSADGRVGLANRRLAILDLSPAGHQPMASPDGLRTIAYNGEIYNYIEVRDELRRQGREFVTDCDTEVILAAYERWDTRCVEHLNGMFAFAIWDAAARRLFAARDRFGEKPFYYALAGDRFVFASEIKALLADPSIPRRIDDVVAARYLALALVDCDERTFFADVRQLPAAHTLTLDPDRRLSIAPYWTLDLAAERRGSAGELADEFRSLFTSAVNLRLRSDVAVGSSLSGGLDSTSVVCTMQRLLAGHPTATQQTFSARYRAGGTDEGDFIEAAVARAGAESHGVWIDGRDLADEIDRFVWHQDEPVAHTSQFAQWKVMGLARDAGVTVLLDGQGADEIIGGYPSPTFGFRYAQLLTSGRPLELIRELAQYRRNHGSVASALRYIGGALLPQSVRDAVRVRVLGTADFPRATTPAGGSPPGFDRAQQLRRALYRALTVTSLPSLLRYGDRNSMAFSREARLPFLDHRLVEFAYALPPELLVSRGMTKVILRRAMDGVIPDRIRDRMDKVGFATPERDWLLGPLRDRVHVALTALQRRGIVDAKAIDRRWAAMASGHGRSATIWRLTNLELWMQQFIDRSPVPAAPQPA